jgi:hypothetical protein
MPAERKASIDPNALEGKTLDQITAADFLSALETTGLSAVQALRVWPEKKKVELWNEPEHYNKVSVGDILTVIRAEKKKYEFEKSPWMERFKQLGEDVVDPRDYLRDPVVIDQIAHEVARQLRFMR